MKYELICMKCKKKFRWDGNKNKQTCPECTPNWQKKRVGKIHLISCETCKILMECRKKDRRFCSNCLQKRMNVYLKHRYHTDPEFRRKQSEKHKTPKYREHAKLYSQTLEFKKRRNQYFKQYRAKHRLEINQRQRDRYKNDSVFRKKIQERERVRGIIREKRPYKRINLKPTKCIFCDDLFTRRFNQKKKVCSKSECQNKWHIQNKNRRTIRTRNIYRRREQANRLTRLNAIANIIKEINSGRN